MTEQLIKEIEDRREIQDRLLPELVVKLIAKGLSEQMIDDQVDMARKLIDQQLWMNQHVYMESLGNLAEQKS